MAEQVRPARGVLDTSVVIDLEHIPVAALPLEVAIAAVTLAELAAGSHAADNPGGPASATPTSTSNATR